MLDCLNVLPSTLSTARFLALYLAKFVPGLFALAVTRFCMKLPNYPISLRYWI